ncbi:MAG: glycosyltransferase family 39 protein [Candidatus Daviesbacteria bacterium]|nr:glycosyltransferase family 39 protein [Candidatus Daviesbacteria bacterium]
MPLKNWINSNSVILIIILIYFLISIIKIEHPGVNNDQLMFVNTATLHPDNQFLWKSWHGIPTMIFPYIGALKSYLYMPIFYFFGVNIWSIRLPQIILISISWFMLYQTVMLGFNKKLAVLTILLLSLDPSIIIYSKTDQGPTVLEFFLKIAAVYLLYLYLSKKKRIFYFSIFPILALGIFNKLNFIWFVNAFMISFIIFYWRIFYNDFKKVDKLFPFLIFCIPYFFLIKIFTKISREVVLSYKDFTDPVALSNVFNNLLIFYNNLINIINGSIFYNIIYGHSPTPLGIYFSGLILLILFTGTYYLIAKHKEPLRPFYFFSSLVLLTILQLLLTKKAISVWHALSIYPFFVVILALAILQFKKNIFLALVGIIISYQIIVNLIYFDTYSKPTKLVAYTSAIYDLIDFAKTTKANFVCLDVDICNQLLSFNQEVKKYQELFFFLDPPTYTYSFIKLAGNFSRPEEFLYIAHGDSNSHFPNLKKEFFKYLDDNKINYKKVKEFKDGDSINIAFEIYEVSK